MIHRHVEPYREVTPFAEDMTDDYKEEAYECHAKLVEMGGRPTRPVLENPAGKAVYKEKEGIIHILDEHGTLTCTLAYDMSPLHHHWTRESVRFSDELDRWKEFQDYQHRNPQLSPLQTAFDTVDVDRSLKAILLRLNAWREFEVYHQCKVDNRMMLTWRNRQSLARLFEKEATSELLGEQALDRHLDEDAISEPPASKQEIQSNIGGWLEELYPRQMDYEASQKQLTCIEDQAFEILSEASASLEGAPLLCQQLEKKMEEQTNCVYQQLLLLEARPSHAPQPSSSTALFVQRILHWESETRRLLKEHREWRIFLRWRRSQANANTSVNAEEQQSNKCHVDLALWFDYVTYQESEVNKAKSWVSCWQRLQRSVVKEIEDLTKAGEPTPGGTIESTRTYVERFQQDVRTAEARLRSAQQQLADLSLQYAPSAAQEGTRRGIKSQKPLPSAPNPDAFGSRFTDQENLDSRTSPKKARRPSPTHETSGSVHPSIVPGQVGGKGAKKGNTDKGQLVPVPDTVILDQGIRNDDIPMTDVPDRSQPHDAIGEGQGVEPMDTFLSGVKDPPMIDATDPVNTNSHSASGVDAKGRGTSAIRTLALPVHQIPTSRKTRATTKLDQAISSRVSKITGKKSIKKAKAFTERQTMTLLNAGSINNSSKDPPSFRRSERLKEKSEAPATISPP